MKPSGFLVRRQADNRGSSKKGMIGAPHATIVRGVEMEKRGLSRAAIAQKYGQMAAGTISWEIEKFDIFKQGNIHQTVLQRICLPNKKKPNKLTFFY